jgi:SAM-dependent methyltransferase
MEFNKYKEFGDYHWREYENKTAYGKHVDKLISWIRKGSILDIGAGDGLITYKLNADGVENDPYALEIAKNKKANVIYGDAYNLDKTKKYDNVYLGDVIEHLEYPEKCLKEIYNILNEKGYLYIVTPPARLDGKVQDKYHYREYTPNQLSVFLESNGFKLVLPIEVIDKFKRMYAIFKKV